MAPLSMTPDGYLPARHPKRRKPVTTALQPAAVESTEPAAVDDGTRYNVDRLYFRRPGHRRRILSRVTLAQAQAHCSDLNTSSSTAWTSSAIRRTKRYGPWFDSYTEDR